MSLRVKQHIVILTALTVPDTGKKQSSGNANYDVSVLIGGVMAGVVVVFVGIMLFIILRR